MRFTQLRVFLAVIESGSIRAAARKLAVSAPAVTKSIRQLEEDVQARLLERTQHGVILTPAGRALAARARVVESELRKAEEDIAHLADGRAGSVALGAGMQSLTHIVPDAVVQFRRQYPDARIRIVEGRHSALLPLVRDETLDFALGLRSEVKLESALAFRPLFRENFAIVGRKGHPLRGARSLERLAEAEWITFAPRVAPGGVLDQVFSAAHLPAPPVSAIECESLNGIVALLARTDMLSITSRRLLAMPLARDVLQEIPVAERLPSVTQGMFTRADAPLTRVAAAMARAVTVVARRLASREQARGR